MTVVITVGTIILITALFLSLAPNKPQWTDGQVRAEYNRGYLEGRYSAFGELAECEQYSTPATMKKYQHARQTMLRNGYEVYIACEE